MEDLKVFATKHIGNNDTMACETHGIHSTLHNGDGTQPRQWVDRKREKKGIGSEFFV